MTVVCHLVFKCRTKTFGTELFYLMCPAFLYVEKKKKKKKGMFVVIVMALDFFSSPLGQTMEIHSAI